MLEVLLLSLQKYITSWGTEPKKPKTKPKQKPKQTKNQTHKKPNPQNKKPVSYFLS